MILSVMMQCPALYFLSLLSINSSDSSLGTGTILLYYVLILWYGIS